MKKQQTHLSITIEPEINKLLDELGFNKSKLINKLLEKFLKEQKDIQPNK